MIRGRNKYDKPKLNVVLRALKWGCIICAGIVFIPIVLLISDFLLPSPFPVEDWVKSNTGGIHFEKVKFSRFDAYDRLEGIEKFAGSQAKITRMVFGDRATFIFTDNGMVYALAITESGAPSPMIESWQWNGGPHDFPHFGKQYPLSCP